MAAFDYIEARAIAEELILEFGDTASLITKGQSGRDDYGQPISTEDTEITGLLSPLLDYDSSMMGAYEQSGSEIIAGDKFAYFHSDSNPVIGMELAANGKLYRVQSIVWLDALDGTRVYTKLQLRS